MSVLQISLEQFEGPLALLLYLIRKEEMDIYDISIHHITKQYLEHIQKMKTLDLEVASEFITMAATLIQIKSKMLLPRYDEELEDSLEDPRRELVRQLVEYQRYQNASKKLLDMPILGRDQWRRGFKEDIILEENQGIELDENGLFGLISSFRSLIKAVQKRVHRVAQAGQSIAARIMEIRDLLIPGERKVMRELIRADENDGIDKKKNKVLVTFLSLLELAKMGLVHLFQSEPFADIHIETVKTIDRDVIQRVESYDGGNAEQAALNILAKGEKLAAEEIVAHEAEEAFANAQVAAEVLAQVESVQTHLQHEFTFEQKSLQESGPTREGDIVMDDTATDAEIFAAEKELGFDVTETEHIQSSMEPIEEILENSKNLTSNPNLKIDTDIDNDL